MMSIIVKNSCRFERNIYEYISLNLKITYFGIENNLGINHLLEKMEETNV